MARFAERTFFDKGLRTTKDGYLVATARIARTGIQTYSGKETDDPQGRATVRIFRPEAEVFNRDSLASLAHRPVTLDHPQELVTADNWKDHAVGHVDGEVLRDGDMVRVNMLICDSRAIQAVRRGHSQLSVGYDSELDWTPGVTPKGEPYDCSQRNIRGNHVALTPSARGGPLLRLGDKETDNMPGIEREPMTRTITVDGIELKLPEMTAALIDRALADVAKLRKDNETLTGTVAALTKQVTDAAVSDADLDKRVAERQSVIALARKVVGDAYKPEGRSLTDIRRDAVAHKLGDAAKGLTDEGVAGAFAVVTAGLAPSTSTQLGDGPRELAMNLSRPSNLPGTGGDVEAAFEERGRYVREAWRGNNAAGARLPQQH